MSWRRPNSDPYKWKIQQSGVLIVWYTIHWYILWPEYTARFKEAGQPGRCIYIFIPYMHSTQRSSGDQFWWIDSLYISVLSATTTPLKVSIKGIFSSINASSASQNTVKIISHSKHYVLWSPTTMWWESSKNTDSRYVIIVIFLASGFAYHMIVNSMKSVILTISFVLNLKYLRHCLLENLFTLNVVIVTFLLGILNLFILNTLQFFVEMINCEWVKL